MTFCPISNFLKIQVHHINNYYIASLVCITIQCAFSKIPKLLRSTEKFFFIPKKSFFIFDTILVWYLTFLIISKTTRYQSDWKALQQLNFNIINITGITELFWSFNDKLYIALYNHKYVVNEICQPTPSETEYILSVSNHKRFYFDLGHISTSFLQFRQVSVNKSAYPSVVSWKKMWYMTHQTTLLKLNSSSFEILEELRNICMFEPTTNLQVSPQKQKACRHRQ